MSAGSSFEIKEQIKRSINIVDLVGDYLQLRREGRGYKALCPWHDDSRPSLQVNPERQSFKCWVCDVGGDVFSFIMKMENVEFPEALAMLAERAGIPLVSAGGSGRPTDDKKLLQQAMAWAEELYHQFLLTAPAAAGARDYLARRGLSDESLSRFHLGFAPYDWEWIVAQARGTRFTPQILEAVDLIRKRANGPGYWDTFRGRVLFSIRDPQGRPAGFGGRVIPVEGEETPAAKYLNSRETPLYTKSSLLYGLDFAGKAITKQKTAIVMEGYTDCLMAQQFGITNAVAVCGVALGERHVRLLRRYADRIVLVLDGDKAGRDRTNQLLEMFIAEPIDLRVLTLPEELDPCDFLLARGREAFEDLLAGAANALEHKFRTATESISATSGVHEANQALEEVLSTLAKAPRLAAAAAGAARLKEEQILNRLATKFGISEERVRARLTSLRQTARPRERAAVAAAEPEAPTVLDPWERRLLEIAIVAPELLPRMREEILAEQLTSPSARAILTCSYEWCGASSSLFDHLLVQFDEPELKSLIVDLDERGRAKGGRRLLPNSSSSWRRSAIGPIKSNSAEERLRWRSDEWTTKQKRRFCDRFVSVSGVDKVFPCPRMGRGCPVD